MSTVIEPQLITDLPGCVVEAYDTQEAWLASRDSVIGASETASIFGVGYADEDPLTVWGRKRGLIESKPDTEAIECGRVLQPAIIELFRRRYLRAFPDSGARFDHEPLGEFTLCRSLKHEWIGASLDDYFVDRDGVAIVEAKNVGTYLAHDWDNEDAALKFVVQAQQQMFVTGAERNFVVGLIGGNKLVWKETRRNDKFIDAMIPRLAEFQEMVDEGIEPPATATEASKKALQKLHPLDNGQTIVLPLEAYDWHRKLAAAKADAKDAAARELEFGNKLRQAIGDASYGQLPDGSRYSYRHQDKTIYTCDNCGHSKRSAAFRVLRKTK